MGSSLSPEQETREDPLAATAPGRAAAWRRAAQVREVAVPFSMEGGYEVSVVCTCANQKCMRPFKKEEPRLARAKEGHRSPKKWSTQPAKGGRHHHFQARPRRSYYDDPKRLNFRDRMGSGALLLVWSRSLMIRSFGCMIFSIGLLQFAIQVVSLPPYPATPRRVSSIPPVSRPLRSQYPVSSILHLGPILANTRIQLKCQCLKMN